MHQQTSTKGDFDMHIKRMRWIVVGAVIVMLSLTMLVGADVQRTAQTVKETSHVRQYSTPLVYDGDPSDVRLAVQDEQIKTLIKNQDEMAKWINEATAKLSTHDVEFAQIKFYGYGMVGLAGLLNTLGLMIQWKKK